jgi:pyruvate/2-oxoglutarate/acetoin dehydrogenase E1 component/biotin carboxyl carrier protein
MDFISAACQDGGSMRELTMRDALKEALREEMRRDPRVFIAGVDMSMRGGTFGVTMGLVEEFGPERVRDTPISEAAIVGCGLGAAITGMRPVVDVSQIDWITIAMDQIVNQVAKLRYMLGGQAKVPLVIRTSGGAGRGNAAQHSQSLEAWFAHVPGLYVVMASTPRDAKGLLKAAIRDDNPVLFIDHRLSYNLKGPVPEEEYLVPLGVADVKRRGRDVTVVATSLMVHRALAAAEELAREGIEIEVIDPRCLVPLDLETILQSVQRTGKLVVVHEEVSRVGVAGDLVAQVVERGFDYLDAPPRRVTSLDVHVPYSRRLEGLVIPTPARIIEACRDVCGRGIQAAAGGSRASAAPAGAAPAGACEVQLPKLSTTMEEGTILRWLRQEGDRVVQGEPLFELETDKAAVEVEAPCSGRLARILAPAGTTLPILTPVALVEPESPAPAHARP